MVYLLIAIGIFLADFGFKRYMEQHLRENEEGRTAAGGRLLLRRINNSGSAGGFFKNHGKVVEMMSAAVLGIAAVRFVVLLFRKGQQALKLGYAMLLGGGMGNLVDRSMHGYVTDFFSFRTKLKHFGKLVFNLADLFIAAGSVLLFFASLFSAQGKKK